MTVQANNYKEMPAFLELGRRHKCDRVSLHKILDWGSFSPEEYAARAVQLPNHPDHAGLLEMLNDPRFEDPLAYLSNLSELKQERAPSQPPTAEHAVA